MIETKILPGQYPIRVTFHDVDEPMARADATTRIGMLALGNFFTGPLERVEVYPGGFVATTVRHVTTQHWRKDTARPPLRFGGGAWLEDTFPWSAPSEGGRVDEARTLGRAN